MIGLLISTSIRVLVQVYILYHVYQELSKLNFYWTFWCLVMLSIASEFRDINDNLEKRLIEAKDELFKRRRNGEFEPEEG